MPDPAVPTQVLVDGQPADTWGLTWVKVPSGQHTISFRDVNGFATPADQAVQVTPGETTTVTGTFVQPGTLRVSTSPPTPGTIFVDGIARNDWGIWTDLLPGTYEVCFGPLTGVATPPCEIANVTAGVTTQVTGAFS